MLGAKRDASVMHYKYRITKYNPQNRDKNGHYLVNEWTSFSHIGQAFDSITLSEEEYYRFEDAYISSAVSFLQEAGIDALRITQLENSQAYQEARLDIRRDKTYTLTEAETLFRLVLREKIWCKFEWQDKAYVHFGWDYYMYLGVPCNCLESIRHAGQKGLFVEPFDSPYLEE